MNNSIEDIAKHYFDLSNKARLNDIRNMFGNDTTYSSVATGLFYGVDDIMSMMTTFFSQYKMLHWHIDELSIVSDHIVEIHFTLQSTNHDGIKVTRKGIEKLIINDNKIRHIEITNA